MQASVRTTTYAHSSAFQEQECFKLSETGDLAQGKRAHWHRNLTCNVYLPLYYAVCYQKLKKKWEKKNILMQLASNFMVIFVQWDNLR